MKCAGCMKKAKDAKYIKCTYATCEKIFCPLCINTSSLTDERQKNWKCPDCCAALKKGGDNSLTPIRLLTEDLNITKRKKTASDSSCVQDMEIRELTSVITRLTGEFSSLKTKLEEVTNSLSYCHERMDELVNNISSNNSRLKVLEKSVSDVASLHSTVAALQLELNTQTQINLRNELEIVGISECTSENLEQVVKSAVQKVGIQLKEEDVDWITRVGPRRPAVLLNKTESGRMPRPIVVRLLRRSKRDQILKAAKSSKSVTSEDVDLPGPTHKIFFNERLTKANRILFREARIRAKSHGYRFCWCNQGSVYIRQQEGKPAVLIRTRLELDRILSPIVDNTIS